MATENRQPTAALSQFRELLQRPEAFEFAAAMRLLECAFPASPRLGESVRPLEDPIRLAQEPSLSFPTGPLAGFERGGSAPRFGNLRVRHPGLFGSHGALPLHLTEHVLARIRQHRDYTLRDFLDVFHHRLLSLFWRALAAAKPAVHLDRPASDRFGFYVGSLAGVGAATAGASDPRIDRARRHWGGHFSRVVRNGDGLAALLGGFFGVGVTIEEFVGRWVEMPSGGLRLGAGTGGGRLGNGSFLGESLWDCSQSVRINLGPLDLRSYERLLPGGSGWERMRQLVDSYVGVELSWDARLILKHDEVPPLRLGGSQRLGWTSWLLPPANQSNASDLVVRPDRPFRHPIRSSDPVET